MGHVWSIAYRPDAACVATASRDATVRLLDSRTGEPLREPLRGHAADVFCVAFSPDGAWLASSSQDGTVRIWDARTGEQLRSMS